MAKGIPHVLSGRRPKKPIIRPQRLTAAQKAQAARDAREAVAKPAAKKTAAKPAAKKTAAKPAKAKKAAKGKAPLHLLDGSVADLRKALATGKHDAHLKALAKAEVNGKTRKSALDAIEARM